MSIKSKPQRTSPSPTATLREMAMESDEFVVYPRMWERIGGWEKYTYSAPLVGKPGGRGKLCTEGFVFSVNGKKTPDLCHGDIHEGATVVVLKRPGQTAKAAYQPRIPGVHVPWPDKSEVTTSENGDQTHQPSSSIDDDQLVAALVKALRVIIKSAD